MVQAFDDTRPRRLIPASTGGGASTGRIPPHNLEAEESLLGAMLLSRDAIATAMEICKPEDFYKQSHGHIFTAITSLFSQGEPADWVTVTEELRRRGLLETIGDPSVFVSLQANTPSIGNAEHYAKIIEEHALLRRLVAVAGEINELGYSLPEDVSEVLDKAESLVFDVAQRRVTDSMTPLRDLLGPEPRPPRAAVQPGGVDHRPGHRLRRPRRAAGRPPAVQPHRGGGPARHGQDRLRPRHGGPRRHQAQQAGAPLLPGDEPPRAHPAPAQLRGPGRRHPDAHRQAATRPTGRRSATPSAG